MAVTLKLPPELKNRVASVVKGTDKSAHAFMVEAIEQQTTLAEKRRAFVAAARAEYAARIAGKPVRRARLRRWRK